KSTQYNKKLSQKWCYLTYQYKHKKKIFCDYQLLIFYAFSLHFSDKGIKCICFATFMRIVRNKGI
ncbi:TPA: hypothetical protein ACWZ62_004896, partial [Escherichia coli]